jgi:hypothetical protein
LLVDESCGIDTEPNAEAEEGSDSYKLFPLLRPPDHADDAPEHAARPRAWPISNASTSIAPMLKLAGARLARRN